MALRALVFILLFVAALGVQQAFATMIDFDTFPDGTIPADQTHLTTQYDQCGVSLFTTINPSGPEIRSFNLGSSLPNILAPSGGAFNFIGPIGIEFGVPVSGDISIIGQEVRHAGLRLQAFDSANVLVSSATIPVNSQSLTQIMTVSGDNIVRLLVSQIVEQTGGFVDGYSIDDLIFPGPPCELQSNVIGGEIIPIQITLLVLAGAHSFTWVIPVTLSILGIGLFIVSKKEENY